MAGGVCCFLGRGVGWSKYSSSDSSMTGSGVCIDEAAGLAGRAISKGAGKRGVCGRCGSSSGLSSGESICDRETGRVGEVLEVAAMRSRKEGLDRS